MLLTPSGVRWNQMFFAIYAVRTVLPPNEWTPDKFQRTVIILTKSISETHNELWEQISVILLPQFPISVYLKHTDVRPMNFKGNGIRTRSS